MVQDIIVYVIITIVCTLLIRNALRILRRDNRSGCHGCSGCGLSKGEGYTSQECHGEAEKLLIQEKKKKSSNNTH